MPLLAAMAIGAGIGAIAGVAVYGARCMFSKKVSWNWKDAGAHAVGGLVGGGAFPLVMAGLGAVGLPAAAAYVVAGGVSWGGIWTVAQDAASWALGRREGMASPKKYLVSTAIGLAVSALLLPIASRAIGPGMHLKPHAGNTSAYLSAPRTAAEVIKAEGEFLAYGVLNESAEAGIRSLARTGLGSAGNRALRSARPGVVRGVDEVLSSEDPVTVSDATATPIAEPHEESAAVANPAGDPLEGSTFAAFARRVRESEARRTRIQSVRPEDLVLQGLVESVPVE